jgi:hypothetical protein
MNNALDILATNAMTFVNNQLFSEDEDPAMCNRSNPWELIHQGTEGIIRLKFSAQELKICHKRQKRHFSEHDGGPRQDNTY